MKRSAILSLILLFVLMGAAFAGKQPLTDDAITNNLMIKLANDPVVKGGAFKVDVKGGVATLQGNVETDKQKEKATRVAKKVKGVKQVVNQLVIVTRAPVEAARHRSAGIGFMLLAGSAQDFSHISVEKAVVGCRFTEGPVWSHDGYLLFSDVPNDKILKLTPGEQHTVFREASNGANGNTFDARGRLYTCESRTRRVTRTDKKGNIEVLAEKWEGKRLNAPNDIVVRKDGNVYFTDPAFGNQADNRELDFYGVYRITPKGQLQLVAKPAGRPNGIALSPNGRILYVANSDERNVRAYDLDRNGDASGERVVVPATSGVPDGMKVDEKGNLYIAADGVVVYSPQGKLLTTIPVAETPANCAFGDPDLQSLYITARTSVYRVRLEVKGSVQY